MGQGLELGGAPGAAQVAAGAGGRQQFQPTPWVELQVAQQGLNGWGAEPGLGDAGTWACGDVPTAAPSSSPSSGMSRACTNGCTGSARSWPGHRAVHSMLGCSASLRDVATGLSWLSAPSCSGGRWAWAAVQVHGGNEHWTSFFTARKSVASACTCLRSSRRSWPCDTAAVKEWLGCVCGGVGVGSSGAGKNLGL